MSQCLAYNELCVRDPKRGWRTYKGALQRTYLERGCVHACIQLCTRGYTIVYTRVHFSPLGSRYMLAQSHLGYRYFYLGCGLLDDFALDL